MAHRIKLRADDYDVVGAVPRDLSVIKNFLKRDCAVKRLIEIEEDFLNKCLQKRAEEEAEEAKQKAKKSQIGAITQEEEVTVPDPCTSTSPPSVNAADYCDPCRRLQTSVVLEEVRTN